MALQNNDGETSAAASIEGGIPDARNVTCCICLENFTGGGMSTVTNCTHQYHLQCLLEWCQRSPNCPACRREVSLKEPESQDLLEAVAHERKMKAEELRSARVQITFADLNSAPTEAEIHERLVQYMASMGRRYQFSIPVDLRRSSSIPGNTSRNSNGESSVEEQESAAATSEFQAFSNSLRSMSTRYRDSIVRSTKSWLTRRNSKA